MSVALALMFLIFRYVSAKHNSSCLSAAHITIDNPVPPIGFNLEFQTQYNVSCARTTISNIALDVGIPSINISSRSCLSVQKQSKQLTAITCESESANKSESVITISVINKCCPHGYIYSSQTSKCAPGEPDFSQYSGILDTPAIFLDDRFTCDNKKVLVEYTITSDIARFHHNQLVWQDGSRALKRSEFCMESVAGIEESEDFEIYKKKSASRWNQEYLIRTCQQYRICESMPCVRRCCADAEIYYKKNMTTFCKRDDNDIPFESSAMLKINGNFTKPAVFGILHGLECPKFRLDPDSFSDEAHTISSVNGSLFIPSTGKMYTNNQYCIEQVKNSSDKLYTFLCFDSKVVGNDRIRFKMYPIGLLISCCFYAITLVVYASIEKLRNLPGKILICLVSSLLVAYLGIALGQLMPTSNNKLCAISGFFVYFFLMAAFSWMNITCFDIWKTFGSTKSKNVHRSEQRKRFLWYSLYGWGLPTALTIIMATLSETGALPESLSPNFGNGRCWFTYDTIGYASLLFFSGPLGILLIINLVLFSLTLKYCNRVKREIFRMQSSNAEKPALRSRFFMDKTRFIMNTKLCFVMGITWLLEIASIMFYDHKKNFFWSISDSFNVLLGVFVFFIFVFKRRVWREVLMKLGCPVRNETRRSGNTTCLTQSTYSAPSVSMRKLEAAEKSLTQI